MVVTFMIKFTQKKLAFLLLAIASAIFYLYNGHGQVDIILTGDHSRALMSNGQQGWTNWTKRQHQKQTQQLLRQQQRQRKRNNDERYFALLNTFPNSGTTWTQTIFTAATGMQSESVYNAPGQSTATGWGGTFASMGKQRDMAGEECHFVKSHARLSKREASKYQRAVVLYRDEESNFQANLRYLARRNKTCESLQDQSTYDQLRELYSLSHKRWHCHAQHYPFPVLFVTYDRLLTEPKNAFMDILTFVGYPDADVDGALSKYPPMENHTTAEGSDELDKLEYIPFTDDVCEYAQDHIELAFNAITDPCVKKEMANNAAIVP